MDIGSKLDELGKWVNNGRRRVNGIIMEDYGLWHLLTSCYNTNTIGIAKLFRDKQTLITSSVVCVSRPDPDGSSANVGVSSISQGRSTTSDWSTFAHEASGVHFFKRRCLNAHLLLMLPPITPSTRAPSPILSLDRA